MNNVKKNYLYSLIYQLLTILVPLATTPYLSRILGAEQVGIYSYTNSIVQYFILFAMTGILDYGSRTIAVAKDKNERGRIFGEIYFIQLLTGTLALIAYIWYLHFNNNEYDLIFEVQTIAVIAALLDINWFYFGIEKFKITVTRNIVVKILSLICIFAFVKTHNDLVKYVLIVVFSSFISNLILWLFLKKEIILNHIEIKNCFKHFLPCLILMIPLLSRSIFVYLDKTMLGLMSDMTETGYYEYSEKIILAVTSILTPLGTVMLPRITALISNNEEKLAQKYTALSMDFVVGVGAALTFGTIAVAEPLTIIFLGKEFTACVKIVKIMSLTVLLVGWTNVIRTQCILPYKKDKAYILAVFLGAVVDFIINALLIPKYGAFGAAIGWVFAEIIITFIQTYFASKQLPIIEYIKNCLGYIINAFIMLLVIKIVCFYCTSLVESLILGTTAGIISYTVLTIGYLTIFRKNLWIELVNQVKRTRKM